MRACLPWVLLWTGCLLENKSVGGLPTDAETEESAEDSEASGGDITAEAGGEASSGATQGDVGAPCGTDVEGVEATLVGYDSSCDAGICVFSDNQGLPSFDPCATDADCNEPGGDVAACLDGACVFADAYLDEMSRCSATCTSDAECGTVSGDTTCESGFVCARLSQLGEYCCQGLCVCADDLDDTSLELDVTCSAGDTPGCCTNEDGPVEPTPPGCGENIG